MADEGFSGMADLIRSLQRLPEALRTEAGGVVNATADLMAAEVRTAYPAKEGALKRGVKVEHPEPLRAKVRSTARHAHLYERGTIQRFTNASGANRGTMPASNVFIPAAVKARARMVEHLKGVVKRAKVDGMTGSLDVRGD